MHCFAADVTSTSASELLNFRQATISEYYDNLRAELFDNVQPDPITFEDNREYEVDECLIKHFLNVNDRTHCVQWIGGILERQTGKVKLFKLNDRGSQSLIPPILNSVPLGSWKYIDDWRSYHPLSNHTFIHLTVNHSQKQYARRVTIGNVTVNVHINTLEGVHGEIRRRFQTSLQGQFKGLT